MCPVTLMRLSDDPTRIADSLVRASLSDIDHHWVENACLHALDRPELEVRWAALSALGHLVLRYKQVDVSTVMHGPAHMRGCCWRIRSGVISYPGAESSSQ